MYNSVMKCTEDAINSCGLNALKAHLELMDEMTGTQYGCEIGKHCILFVVGFFKELFISTFECKRCYQ